MLLPPFCAFMACYRLNVTLYLPYAYVLAACSDNLSLSQFVSVQILGRNEQEEDNIKM
jgi:hypothetical protein